MTADICYSRCSEETRGLMRPQVRPQGEQLDWQHRAACRGPQAAVFFPPDKPERRDEKRYREAMAKAICAQCPVIDECLAYALAIREQHGIWGGMSANERRSLARTPTHCP